jgi:hypothetical protein
MKDKKFPKCQMERISVDGLCEKPSSLLWNVVGKSVPVCNMCSLNVLACGGNLTDIPKREKRKQPVFVVSRGNVEYIFRPYIFQAAHVYNGSEMGTISSWEHLQKILEFINSSYNEKGFAKVSKICEILSRFKSNKLSIRANRRLMQCIVSVNRAREIAI